MAHFHEVATAATAHAAGTALSALQLGGRIRVATDTLTLAAQADQGSTMRLCWIPYGATIVDGFVTHGATATSVTIKGGIKGCSTTAVDDNDDIFFTALAAATEAESRSAPKRLQVMLAGTDCTSGPGYKVTDPNGANIILTTVAAANAASGSKFRAVVYFVMD